MPKGIIDWLDLEQNIRVALRSFKNGNIDAKRALIQIDNVLGDATERGYVFD